MGQKVNPIGFRIGVVLNWPSRWYSRDKKVYAANLLQDCQIRSYLKKSYGYAGIAKVEIERPGPGGRARDIGLIIHVARPGLIIGRRGSELSNMESELERMTGQTVDIRVMEISSPTLSAQLVAEGISDQLRKRTSYKRVMKRAIEMAHEAGAKGIKIQMSGRLGGAEMSRTEHIIDGKLPLQTIDANIDFGFTEARTPQGHIGVKVWIYKGLFSDRNEGDEE